MGLSICIIVDCQSHCFRTVVSRTSKPKRTSSLRSSRKETLRLLLFFCSFQPQQK